MGSLLNIMLVFSEQPKSEFEISILPGFQNTMNNLYKNDTIPFSNDFQVFFFILSLHLTIKSVFQNYTKKSLYIQIFFETELKWKTFLTSKNQTSFWEDRALRKGSWSFDQNSQKQFENIDFVEFHEKISNKRINWESQIKHIFICYQN